MTQIGESIAVPDMALEGEDEEKETERCRFIARAKLPSGSGPWWSAGKLGGDEEGDDLTGHSFCAHEDEGGSRSWYGFYPKGAIFGWESVSEEDQISGASDFFKYVAGELYTGDAEHAYDEGCEKIYVIDRAQYDKAQQFASKWRSAKTKYSLALNNCTTFVVKDGTATGVAVPSGGWAFANPASFGKNLAKKS